MQSLKKLVKASTSCSFKELTRQSSKKRLPQFGSDSSIIDEDRIRLSVIAGAGGRGLLRYNGIGGDGGSIFLIGRPDISFRDVRISLKNQTTIKAENGEDAVGTRLIGRKGNDLVLDVPVGVEAVDTKTNLLLARCKNPFRRYVIAHGGKGGCNENCYSGARGEHILVDLHLKLRPNVGLVGFPNAGKSTLMKALIPKKRIKIASYPFTTTKPQICSISDFGDDCNVDGEDDFSLSIADLPGLVEGASANRGKGFSFLKHLEYSDMLLMVVDIMGFQLRAVLNEPFRSALETVALLNVEMEKYSPLLTRKPAVLAINKIDLPDGEKKANELVPIMRRCDWADFVSKEIRPVRPLHFDEVIPVSARQARIGDLKYILKSIYSQLHPLSDYDLRSPAEDAKPHLI